MHLVTRLAHAEARIPPASPVKTMGDGCVRFDDQGRLWLLSKHETGWAAFGFMFDGWDDLFRRYAVRITSYGFDASGPYWIASPATDARKPRSGSGES